MVSQHPGHGLRRDLHSLLTCWPSLSMYCDFITPVPLRSFPSLHYFLFAAQSRVQTINFLPWLAQIGIFLPHFISLRCNWLNSDQ